MPESRGRKPKKKAAPRKPAKRAPAPRRVMPQVQRDDPPPAKPTRPDLIEEIDPQPLPEIPEPASHDQLLVALAGLDPLTQEVMIAQRLSVMPSQREGGIPVNVPRPVRPVWARQLRRLGIFCIPELATHKLVGQDSGGIMANHVGAQLRSLTTQDMWDIAKQQNPELASKVDAADTPEKKRALMKQLASQLPMEQRLALERLMDTDPESLAQR